MTPSSESHSTAVIFLIVASLNGSIVAKHPLTLPRDGYRCDVVMK